MIQNALGEVKQASLQRPDGGTYHQRQGGCNCYKGPEWHSGCFDSQKSVAVANRSQGKKDGQPDRMLHDSYD